MSPANGLAELKNLVRGAVHAPADSAYDAARQVWNGMIDRRPAAVVCAAGVADLMATLRFASERGLPVAIRGGGHNVAGTSVGDGAIVIDLARCKSVRVDPAQRKACAAGGVLWNEYDCETQAFGLASPGGAISTTGIAGLTLGGGYGSLSRRYGMACDNLLSADVVLASGQFVTASPGSHPDLFWALRGGGGNFGVVTSFEFQLHPLRKMLAGLIAFPFEMSKAVLQRFRELCLHATDDLTLMAAMIPTPDAGRCVVAVIFDSGDQFEGESAAKALRELGSVAMDTVAPVPYCSIQQSFDVSYPKGQRHYWKSAFMQTLPDEVIDLAIESAAASPSPLSVIMVELYRGAIATLPDDVIDLAIESAAASPSPLNVIMVELYGGAIARVPAGATAFGQFNFSVLAISDNAAIDAEQRAWARDAWTRALPHSTGGTYVNYLSEGEDVHAAYSDARFQRLAKIKAQYDPANLFRFNQNIPPAKA